jgi:hypothetical protein
LHSSSARTRGITSTKAWHTVAVANPRSLIAFLQSQRTTRTSAYLHNVAELSSYPTFQLCSAELGPGHGVPASPAPTSHGSANLSRRGWPPAAGRPPSPAWTPHAAECVPECIHLGDLYDRRSTVRSAHSHAHVPHSHRQHGARRVLRLPRLQQRLAKGAARRVVRQVSSPISSQLPPFSPARLQQSQAAALIHPTWLAAPPHPALVAISHPQTTLAAARSHRQAFLPLHVTG